MTVETLGIDIAKNVFQLHGVNQAGHCTYQRRMSRDRLLPEIAQLAPCTIVIEACTGAFYWARKLSGLGHTVRVISPQYVKPFARRRQKNDGNDAEAICVAGRQPHMQFVPHKSIEQQDIQAVHRARQRLVNHRTSVVSQIRGMLLDRGFAIAVSIGRARLAIPEIIGDLANELTALARETIAELYDLFRDLDRRIASFDDKIERIFKSSETCQRIATIKGVGPKTATAIVAAVGDGREFKNGRHLAAWLGLVPRQHSSGDRRVLMGITKRGDQHLRSMLVHGARSVVRTAGYQDTPLNAWVNQLRERRGFNRATVAVANKTARMIWALLRSGDTFRAAS
ncbi:MAG: IS110 family transposase [Hyphomicrobium sp.]